jgi:hypothetical protein
MVPKPWHELDFVWGMVRTAEGPPGGHNQQSFLHLKSVEARPPNPEELHTPACIPWTVHTHKMT